MKYWRVNNPARLGISRHCVDRSVTYRVMHHCTPSCKHAAQHRRCLAKRNGLGHWCQTSEITDLSFRSSDSFSFCCSLIMSKPLLVLILRLAKALSAWVTWKGSRGWELLAMENSLRFKPALSTADVSSSSIVCSLRTLFNCQWSTNRLRIHKSSLKTCTQSSR